MGAASFFVGFANNDGGQKRYSGQQVPGFYKLLLYQIETIVTIR